MIGSCECNWVISSVVERLLYTQDAVGSNPTLPILYLSQYKQIQPFLALKPRTAVIFSVDG